MSRIEYEHGPGIYLCAGVLVAFNWLLWYFNHFAFYWVHEATARDLPEFFISMAEADRLHYYDVMAGAITTAIGFATLKRDRKWLFVTGAICVLIWLILITLGFIGASVSLVDVL